MNYYNTTCLAGEELRQAIADAARQEDKILLFFKHNPSRSWAPSEINAAVLPNAPLTSVRRAITNLTKAGQLVKTSTQQTGRWGKPEYLWIYYQRGESSE